MPTKDYLHIATSLRSEAARNRDTIEYLEAITRIQERTAEYIDKQFGRGELDLCEGSIQGFLELLKRPGDREWLNFMAFGRGKYGKVGGV